MAQVYETNQFRKGLKIEYEGSPWVIVDFQHVKPGKGTAFTRTRMKNLLTGGVLERNFRSGEVVGIPDVQQRQMQYLYKENTAYTFMDTSNYEQVSIEQSNIETEAQWLKENTEVDVLFYKGRPISMEIPTFVELKITNCEPGIRGDTATGASKPATLETGATVNVPLFVNEGEVIRVDTRTGDYQDRVK